MGDLLQCNGPPDVVSGGVPNVLIGTKAAARMTDSCAHGGIISIGCPTVLIGSGGWGPAKLRRQQIADALATGVFPGQQHFGNCGVQSTAQLIYLATGKHPSEVEILKKAIHDGLAETGRAGHPEEWGGTTTVDRQKILLEYGVKSDIVKTTRQALSQALRDGKPVIVSADAGLLWSDTRFLGSGHAVVVTGGSFDDTGKLQTVTVNDTGLGQRHVMNADDFFRSTDNYGPGSEMNFPSTTLFPN